MCYALMKTGFVLIFLKRHLSKHKMRLCQSVGVGAVQLSSRFMSCNKRVSYSYMNFGHWIILHQSTWSVLWEQLGPNFLYMCFDNFQFNWSGECCNLQCRHIPDGDVALKSSTFWSRHRSNSQDQPWFFRFAYRTEDVQSLYCNFDLLELISLLHK